MKKSKSGLHKVKENIRNWSNNSILFRRIEFYVALIILTILSLLKFLLNNSSQVMTLVSYSAIFFGSWVDNYICPRCCNSKL